MTMYPTPTTPTTTAPVDPIAVLQDVPAEMRAIVVVLLVVLGALVIGWIVGLFAGRRTRGPVTLLAFVILMALTWPVASQGLTDTASSLRGLRGQAATYAAGQPAGAVVASLPGEGCPGVTIDDILLTIRTRESGGNYGAQNPYATASGAYQFIDATWAGLGGSGHAKDAPAEEQDRRARVHVEQILAATGGEVEMVPASWYVGVGGALSLDWDQVPKPDEGNTLTIRQYVDKWLAMCRGAVASRAGV